MPATREDDQAKRHRLGLAAAQGDAEAQCHLGGMHYLGQGRPVKRRSVCQVRSLRKEPLTGARARGQTQTQRERPEPRQQPARACATQRLSNSIFEDRTPRESSESFTGVKKMY